MKRSSERSIYFLNAQLLSKLVIKFHISLISFRADGIRLLSDDSDTERIPLYVDATGFVVWLAAANYLVKCNVDITFYPFDSQTCSMKVCVFILIIIISSYIIIITIIISSVVIIINTINIITTDLVLKDLVISHFRQKADGKSCKI